MHVSARVSPLIATVCSAALLSGCALLGVKKQVIAEQHQGVVTVEATNLRSAGAPTYALALVSGQREPVAFQKIETSGVAFLLVPLAPAYTIFAFTDSNRNRAFDPGEPAAVARQVQPARLDDPDKRAALIPLTLGTDPALQAEGQGLKLPAGKTAGTGVEVAIGTIAKPTDSRFAATKGEEGLWQMDTALQQGGLGIYFAEPYDPNRIPVLFVHGIGGSPQDFAQLIPSIDRSRYQAWFFYYPSGFRLGKAANALDAILDVLLKKHGVTRLNVVAHSMGGLVSRAAIQRLKTNYGKTPVEKFVAISTPWGGDDAASSGLKAMKYPIPAWIDMNPKSTFLNNLWKTPLPSPTRFFMIYGFATKSLPWLSHDNDGIINEQSAADARAQAAAERVFVAPYSHMGVLQAKDVRDKMNVFLNARP